MKTSKNLAAIALCFAIASCSPETETQTQTQPNPTQTQNAIAANQSDTAPKNRSTAQNPVNTTNPDSENATTRQRPDIAPKHQSTAQNPANTSNPNSGNATTNQRPDTKTETISFEGSPYEMTLNLFDNVAAPFTTYYDPEAIIADGGCSEEGCGFRFSGRTPDNQPNDDVYLHFFFPQNVSTLDELREMYITGSDSLMANNPNWQVPSWENENAEQYPWIKETTVFFDETERAMGQIMLAEHNNEVFVIIDYMPGEYGDGFAPRFGSILENLEFRS